MIICLLFSRIMAKNGKKLFLISTNLMREQCLCDCGKLLPFKFRDLMLATFFIAFHFLFLSLTPLEYISGTCG